MDKSSIFSKRVKCFLTAGVAAILLSFGCEGGSTDDSIIVHESYGLDMVLSLSLSYEDISCMRNNTYAKPGVRGVVRINGVPYSATISHSGATSVDDYKKSFEVELDDKYVGRTIYRINAMPSDAAAMRAMLAYRVFELNGFDMPSLKPAALWINDEYAGLFLWQEKVDAQYFEKRRIEPISLYQAEDSIARMDDTANLEDEFSVKIGSKEMVDLEYLIQLLIGPQTQRSKEELEKALNIDSLLRYMAVTAYIDSYDGIVNNFYLARTRKEPRLTIIPWDLDGTFYETVSVDDGDFFERNAMMTHFFSEKPYSEQYRKHYEEVASSAGAEILGEAIDEWVDEIRDAYENDRFLSGGKLNLDEHAEQLKAQLREMETQ